MRRNRKRLRMLLAATALVVVTLAPQPASAHWSEERRTREVWREQGYGCIEAKAMQNHVGHYSSTVAHNCNGASFSTWHGQYEDFYKTRTWGNPGEFCFREPWVGSPQTHNMHTFRSYDPGH